MITECLCLNSKLAKCIDFSESLKQNGSLLTQTLTLDYPLIMIIVL